MTRDDTAYEERHRLLTLSWRELVGMSAGVPPDACASEEAVRGSADDDGEPAGGRRRPPGGA
ncbi:hypothetical protein [Streptomyces sp. IBSBF 2435]|uniref:hypothetical protein n=1 Tax=Streptomyces sp. IBSBF 2435 TaxID=2903531 RepID=UPI002FDBDA45